MITRGHIIGEIVDSFAQIQNQINFRAKLGLLDLNKYCEDFVGDIINLTFNLNLKNANLAKSNFPAIDLEDKKKKIAYQVTSRPDKKKVNDMIEKITNALEKDYDRFYLFTLGSKISTEISPENIEKSNRLNFTIEKNIFDFNDLLKHIIALKTETLHAIYNIIQQRVEIVISELDVPDESGEYRYSLKNKYEWAPKTICENALLLEEFQNKTDLLEDAKNLFNRLAKIPRATREVLELIVLDGEFKGENFEIDLSSFIKKIKFSEQTLIENLRILQNHKLININEPGDEPGDKGSISTSLQTDILNEVLYFSFETEQTSKIIVSLDFTLLDSKSEN